MNIDDVIYYACIIMLFLVVVLFFIFCFICKDDPDDVDSYIISKPKILFIETVYLKKT